MYCINTDNKKIALKISSYELKDGLSFFTEDDDFIQVGGWNYPKGKSLASHIHNDIPRLVGRTQEFIYVIRGLIKVSIYDDNDTFLEELYLKTNDFLVLFAGGHGYEILENNTQVIEVKNGPYLGADVDRRRINL